MNEDDIARFFPYPRFRLHQKKAILFCYDVFKRGRIGLLSSPCGTGKSISVLTAFLLAREHEASGRLFALTRTRNQLEIYCRELKRIKERSDVQFTASMFKSKREMCPHIRESEATEKASYRDFLRYCKNLKEGTYGYSCEYYQRTKYSGWRPTAFAYRVTKSIMEIGPLLPDEVYELCSKRKLCPYEVTKILARYADIIVGNYNYILSDPVRRAIQASARVRLNEIDCVFDEAHSLPDYAAGLLSDELSTFSIERARREAERFDIQDNGLFEALRKTVQQLGREAREELGLDVERGIERDKLARTLMRRLRFGRQADLIGLASRLTDEGDRVRLMRMKEREAPISYIARCASFLEDWMTVSGKTYVNYAKALMGTRGRIFARVGIKCMDPSLATKIINKLRSTILMSGTLWYKDYYVEVLGMDPNLVEAKGLPNPFPKENRLIVVDTSVTTKYAKRIEAQWMRIAEHVERIVNSIGGRTAVYFPSYEVMDAVLRHVRLRHPTLVERVDTRITDVLDFLRSNKECTIFGVARGKISEGVDMSTRGRSLLSGVLIAGLPYPKKTELRRALLEFFKTKFGKRALEYVIDIPCANAVAQTAGRLIRSPDDRGIIVIMDSRTIGKFKRRLPYDWVREMKAHRKLERIEGDILNFQVQAIKHG